MDGEETAAEQQVDRQEPAGNLGNWGLFWLVGRRKQLKAFWLMTLRTASLAVPLLLAASLNSTASAADILPVTDGTIYSTSTAITNQYIATSFYLRGALEFAALDTSKFASFQLALNPYALPLGDLTIAVYGYGNADGAITGDDYNAGTLLGTLALPANLGYGQDAFFDATDFVRNVPGEFFGFNLRTDSGGDTFSSLEYNYGKPSRLVVTVVPEPSTYALLLVTGAGALRWARRRR